MAHRTGRQISFIFNGSRTGENPFLARWQPLEPVTMLIYYVRFFGILTVSSLVGHLFFFALFVLNVDLYVLPRFSSVGIATAQPNCPRPLKYAADCFTIWPRGCIVCGCRKYA